MDTKERAEQTLEEIRALGADGRTCRCNVADTEAALAMVKEVISEYGRLDILVNNAGITRDNLIMKMSEEDFDAVINANLKGCFNTIKAVSRQMLKQRAGRIINITSVSGILGNAGQANYAASKAGIIGLTKTMARELASRGITVNAVAPGPIWTPLIPASYSAEEVRTFGSGTSRVPMLRAGQPCEVAPCYVFLASDDSSYMTGQVLHPNGGTIVGS